MPTLERVTAAVRAAWCRETCDDSDLADRTPGNPARGQCGATALTVHDLLGGDLLLAEVHLPGGARQGVHWWNRLPDGRAQYLRLRAAVVLALGGPGARWSRRSAGPERPVTGRVTGRQRSGA